MCLRRGARGQHGTRAAEHRVPAIAQPGGAGMICLTRDLDPPSTMCPEPAANGYCPAQVDQTAALLDVQLNE